MSARGLIDATTADMVVGQRARFSGHVFREAYPTMPLVEGRPPEDQFLESKVSANYGAWKVHYDLLGDFYEVSKHEPGPKIIRRDWDRRHIPLKD